ncbi:MAG: DUF4367 domain-containing protein [Candidatus Eremiobacteraeota bacterium]|uniref:MucB/RseB-like sigma(E) regulatory protein n=1 Tax=mine drainage metagenome TaxID=410659 RepID=E6PIQ4_9ZZZZ|nr:DUF4367 domain-containing protein [Candidatus Eremiobacteraeota bacterium]
MQRRNLAAIAAATALLLPGAGLAAQRDASPLLRAALQAPHTVSYVGEIESIRFGAHGTQATLFRVEHRAPDLTHRWYIVPQSAFGETEIERGDTTYVLDPQHHRVLVERNRALDDRIVIADNLGLMLRNYRPVQQGTGHILGFPVDIVALVNNYTGNTMMRLWLDARSHLVIERKVYGDDGALLGEQRFENLAYAKDIPMPVFAIPSDLKRVDRTVHRRPSNDIAAVLRSLPFKAERPHYLPEGFIAVAADRTNDDGIAQAHLLYSDGIRMISLFENASASLDLDGLHVRTLRVGPLSAKLASSGSTSLLSWSKNGIHYALVGSLDSVELTKIAASIAP